MTSVYWNQATRRRHCGRCDRQLATGVQQCVCGAEFTQQALVRVLVYCGDSDTAISHVDVVPAIAAVLERDGLRLTLDSKPLLG